MRVRSYWAAVLTLKRPIDYGVWAVASLVLFVWLATRDWLYSTTFFFGVAVYFGVALAIDQVRRTRRACAAALRNVSAADARFCF